MRARREMAAHWLGLCVCVALTQTHVAAQTLAWSRVYPPLTFSPSARAYAVMSRNATHVIVAGGEGPSGPGASQMPALLYRIGPNQIVGEVPTTGAPGLPVSRAAWAFAEPGYDIFGATNDGAVGMPAGGAYTAVFGGVDATGAETSSLLYLYPDTLTWVAQNQTGGASPVPAARAGAAMAYLPNCQNSTACFVMFGGVSNRGTTLRSDTNVWWPTQYGASGQPTSTRVCGTAVENSMVSLQCPANQYIRSVDFASYGTPTGSCGSYASSSCNAPNSMTVARTACLGQNACNILTSNTVFPDPCWGVSKRMNVQVTCAANLGWTNVPAVGTAPTARSYASLVSSPDGSMAYLFGGQTAGGVTNDLYVLAGAAGFPDAQAGTAELVNIANNVNAFAFQSSQEPGAFASWAISSQATPAFRNSGGQIVCSSTLLSGTTSPWWALDLGSVQSFVSVTITQRLDCCRGSLAGLELYVGNVNSSWSDPSNIRCPNPYPDVPGTSITLNCAASARYIWLRIAGAGRAITLCGVQVWQRVPWVWRFSSAVTNVALGKNAWQSSTYTNSNGGAMATRAVDGFVTNDYGSVPGTCTHTMGNPPSSVPPWWTVDLGAVYDVRQLIVFPRTDCCSWRNRGWQIYIGNSRDFTMNARCANVPADVTPTGTGTVRSTTINCAATGRYVTVFLPWTAGADNILTICEMRVMAASVQNLPAARMGHAAALYRGHMVIAGGTDSNGLRLNDINMMDLATLRWTNVGTLIGSTPDARAFASLLPTGNNSLVMYGGVGMTTTLQDMQLVVYPSCPTWRGIYTATSCYAGASSCFITCLPPFRPGPTSVLTCDPFGQYRSITPPCAGELLPAPPSGSGVAPTVIVQDSQSTLVSWVPITLSNFPTSSFVRYVVATMPTLVSLNNIVAGVPPADWSSWSLVDPLGQQYVAFQDGQVVINSAGTGNCWYTQQQCPVAIRTFPSSVASVSGTWYIEAFVYLDMLGNPVQSGMFVGIGVYDAGLRIAQPYVGIMSNGGIYYVLWEHSYGRWSQTAVLANQLSAGAFVRLVRDGGAGTWTAMYRVNANDAWTTFSTVVPDWNLQNGVAINTANIRPAMLGKNWSGSRGWHYIRYVNIGSSTCVNPGCVRNVPVTAGFTQAITGLSPSTSYNFAVSAINDYGQGPWTPVRSATTNAAPAAAVIPTFNAALNRPSWQIGTWYSSQGFGGLAQYGNDGDLQTNGGAYWPRLACVDTWNGVNNQNPWWCVDLGQPTDVMSMTLYGRSDCCQSRNTGLMFFVGDSTNWAQNTRCPNVNTVLTSPPWWQSFSCQLTGRYVCVASASTSESLNFCELQVWAGNLCPARTALFATTVAGTTCVGATYGRICQQTCNPGFIAVSGSTTATCRGASWSAPPLVCAPVCPDPTPPANLGGCTQSLFAENFANATTAAPRFMSLVSTQPIGTSWQFVDGTLQAAGVTGCITELRLVALSNSVLNYAGSFTLRALVSTADQAGVMFRVTDNNNFYRVVLDANTDTHFLERVVAGVSTILIDANQPILASAWYVLVVTSTNGIITATLNNTLLFSTLDTTFIAGNVGFTARTTASFGWINFDVPCASTCTQTTAQGVCQFTCPPGYQSSNSGTMTCTLSAGGTTAFWTGSPPTCFLPPPTFFGALITTAEGQPVNSAVGAPLIATITDPTSQVLFAIIAGNTNNAFWVDACSGQIKVRNTTLDFLVQPVYNLVVQAYIAGMQATTFTNASVVITLTPVQRPPVVVPGTLRVPHGSGPGTVVGSVNYTSRLPMNVTWTMGVDASGGLFNVTSSGRVVVASLPSVASALNFFATPNSWQITFIATSTANASLFASGVVTVMVTEVNVAPTLQPAQQVFFINQLAANNGASLGPVGAVDLNSQVQESPFASNITYALLPASTAALVCTINATMLGNNIQYATVTGALTDPAMFNIDRNNGTLTFQNVNLVMAASNPGPDPWRLLTVFSFGNSFARTAYQVCVNVSDRFGAWSVGALQVVVTANVPQLPVITSITGNVSMSTYGNEVVTFIGANFDSTKPLFAWYSNGIRTYNASGCAVDPSSNGTIITCTTVPGAGANHVWTVWLDRAAITSPRPLETSYVPASVTSIVNGTTMSTLGGTTVVFMGDNFGPPGTPITVQYGASLQYSCNVVPALASQTAVTCAGAIGSGANLPWTITVAGQAIMSQGSSLLLSYGAPSITSITVQGDSITALDTAGGADVFINGVNFGEVDDVRAPIVVLMTAGGGAQLQLASCSHTTFTQVRCKSAAAVGTNLPLSIGISGVFMVGYTSGNASLGEGLSYRAPVLTQVTGPGTSFANTQGGQAVILYGRHFGPAGYVNTSEYISVSYGGGGLSFSASSCTVLPGGNGMSCVSGAGIGAGLSWQVAVAGQVSNVLASASSYGPPVVTGFVGVGDVNPFALPTDTVEYVLVNGANFGLAEHTSPAAGPSRLSVYYGVPLKGGPVAYMYYNSSCTVAVSHVQLSCTTIPGAGANLVWYVTVQGLTSTQPTTSYMTPVVTAITDLSGSPVLAANVNGGTQVLILGTGFGPVNYNNLSVPLLQTVTYGPTGVEYVLPPGSFSLMNSTCILATLLPGSGSGLGVRVQVADQFSLVSSGAAVLSYAAPVIVGLTPQSYPTFSAPTRPNIVTLFTRNVPVFDGRSRVVVLFGAGVFQQVLLPVVPTTFAAVTAATNADGTMNVTFALPTDGAGMNQPVQLLVVPISIATPTLASAIAASDVTATSLFSYANPVIFGISLVRARFSNGTAPMPSRSPSPSASASAAPASSSPSPSITPSPSASASVNASAAPSAAPSVSPSSSPAASALPIVSPTGTPSSGGGTSVDQFTVPCPFPANDAFFSCSDTGMLMLVITGASFGQNPLALSRPDGVTRSLSMYFNDAVLGGRWVGYPLVYLYSWSHNQIVAFTRRTSGTLNISLTGIGYNGATNVQSITRYYDQPSPYIAALTGRPYYNTTGGDLIPMSVTNLAGADSLTVTIGGRPCWLQTTAGVNITNTRTQIINVPPRVDGNGDNVWDFVVVVPPGQGSYNPIIVTTFYGGVPQASDPGRVLSYWPPTLTSVSVLGGIPQNQTSWATFPTSSLVASTVFAPTAPTLVRVFGSNLGDAPVIAVGDGVLLSGSAVTPCPGTEVYGTPAYQTCYQFTSPAGEGSGLQASFGGQYAPYGYRLVLTAGDQDSQTVLWRYQAPVVLSVLPLGSGFPTAGGVPILIYGWNFGASVRGAGWTSVSVVVADTPAISFPVPCTGAMRINQTAITCTLPVGGGLLRSVQVSVAELSTVAPNIFSYDPPVITGASSSGGTSAPPPSAPSTSNLPWLRGASNGGTLVTVMGRNFGAWDPANSCIMMAWTNRANAATLRCDALGESWMGEFGVVPTSSIVSWNHTSIVFFSLPGIGVRDVELSVKGQRMDLPRTGAPAAAILRFMYAEPQLLSMSPARPRTNIPDVITLTGANFGPPAPAALVAGARPPQVIVRMHYRCVSNASISDPVTSLPCITSSLTVLDHGTLRIPSTLGVGLNKNISISIIDSGPFGAYFLQTSAALTYSYLPSNIAALSNTRVAMTDGLVPVTMQLLGSAVDQGNFGFVAAQQDSYMYTEFEKITRVWFGGFISPNAYVYSDPSTAAISIMVTLNGSITVGRHNVTLQNAGQFAGAPWMGGPPLEIGCDVGYFGRENETCMACPPVGARCPRFNESELDPTLRYPYPIALTGFFNLNGEMGTACPAGQRVGNRDVCIVACQPADACVGANECAEGYTSAPPLYRCGTCAKGYYPSAGACIKCPDSPAALFIGFILIVLAAAVGGFILNKKGVNIAFVSIGVDFLQVVAMFANARIPWPPAVKQLFQILAAFNLNIEVVAPECLIPNVQFTQKFAFIVLLPVSLGLLFSVLHIFSVCYKYVVKGQRKDLLNHTGGMISAFLVLFYVLYLYLTKTLLDVFNCTPTDPPDGRTYLQVVFEPCGEPGGTQERLLPWAVIGLCVYTFGYPAFVVTNLWRNRALAMEDQYLRAKFTGNDPLTNPNAYRFRRRFGRTYYQFKPDFLLWIGLIIVRKFCIAVVYLMFNRNPAFQMAACLLVLFVAYALQVRCLPYMSPSDFEDVWKGLGVAAFTSALHARLRLTLANVEARGRKRTRLNIMTFDGKVDRTAVLGVLASWVFNYNTVEATLLFCGVLVCLCAVMYQAVRTGGSFYRESMDYITGVVMAVIIFGIVYFVTCVVTEIYILTTEAQRARAMARAKATRKGATKAASGDGALRTVPSEDEEVRIGKIEARMNPMFLSGNGSVSASANAASSLDSITSMAEPPPPELWSLFKSNFSDVQEQLRVLSGELAQYKLREQLGSDKEGEPAGVEMTPIRSAKKKNAFAPQAAPDAPEAPAASRRSMVGGATSNPLMMRSKSMARPSAQLRAAASGAKAAPPE